jgi:hypothetical protein
MGALAAGRWVVTRRYVDKSVKAGGWLEDPAPYAVMTERASRTRLRDGGLFGGMRAVLLMQDARKNAVYGRIVLAGGGRAVGGRGVEGPARLGSLQGLAALPPGPEHVTHVFLDPWLEEAPPAFLRLQAQAPHLRFLHYKYLFHRVRGSPGTTELEWAVPGARAREEAGQAGKRAAGGGQGQVGPKRPRAATAAVVVVETVDLDSDDNNERVNENSDQETSDSEDDVQVLEERLAEERRRGPGRQYADR